MKRKPLSVFWIEDQLDEFIDGGWGIIKAELGKLEFALEGDGPIQAGNVEQAESMLNTFDEDNAKRPDVILLDLMLPQDSDEAQCKRVDLDAGYLIWFEIRQLKKWRSLAQIPIIVITARGRPEYMDQVCNDRNTMWIPKPADPATVAKAISDLLGAALQQEESTVDVEFSTGSTSDQERSADE